MCNLESEVLSLVGQQRESLLTSLTYVHIQHLTDFCIITVYLCFIDSARGPGIYPHLCDI